LGSQETKRIPIEDKKKHGPRGLLTEALTDEIEERDYYAVGMKRETNAGGGNLKQERRLWGQTRTEKLKKRIKQRDGL